MKENNFCRCCLSEECYKDMANVYYIGNRKENYSEMLLTVFNINIQNKDSVRCLICEECVSKLRDAALFKKQVMNAQDAIIEKLYKLNNCTETDNVKISKIEDEEFDNFDDQLSDSFNDYDFVWDNRRQEPEKENLFIIKLASGKDQNESKPMELRQNPDFYKTETEQDGCLNDTCSDDGIDDCQEGDDKSAGKRSIVELKKIIVKKKDVKGLKSKHKLCDKLDTETSVQARENTKKLIQNSNLCLFRSLQNKFGCYLCKAAFLDLPKLREHTNTHTKVNLTRKVQRLRGLSYKNADISDLKCSICSTQCNGLAELIQHLKEEHKMPMNGTDNFLIPYKFQNGFRCVLCETEFNSYLRLSIHMNSHYTNNVCEICGQSFINRLSLRGHVNSMHKERKCALCPITFSTYSAKVKHLRKAHDIHNSKRHCTLCNQTFRYTYLLENHKIKEHGAKQQISKCDECGKTFFSKNNLKTHLRSVHIKERNYPCVTCGMRFFTKCDQKRHERTHEDVRSFSCSYCESKFKSKDSWRRHLKRQHGHVFDES